MKVECTPEELVALRRRPSSHLAQQLKDVQVPDGELSLPNWLEKLLTTSDRWELHEAFDHCRHIGNIAFAEPYGMSDVTLQSLFLFCNRHGLRFSIIGKSHHYPGLTLRVVIWRPQDIEELCQGLVAVWLFKGAASSFVKTTIEPRTRAGITTVLKPETKLHKTKEEAIIQAQAWLDNRATSPEPWYRSVLKKLQERNLEPTMRDCTLYRKEGNGGGVGGLVIALPRGGTGEGTVIAVEDYSGEAKKFHWAEDI